MINDYAWLMHKYEIAKTSVSVVGARGYSGLELVKLLMRHPHADVKYAFATGDFTLADGLMISGLQKIQCLKDTELMSHLTDVVFLATPAEVSHDLAPKIVAAGKIVIDVSGAFRLKKNDYKKWYGFEHMHLPLLQNAQYGLHPWASPVGGKAQVVANPGCYATAVAMALVPVIKNKLIDLNTVVVDAKSGASGAGKKAAENLLFTEVDAECLPYRVGRHQHYPEIQETIENLSGVRLDFHFTTSLLPVRRGIIAGVYANLNTGVTINDVAETFKKAYQHYSLVEIGSCEERPQLLQLKKVVGTGRTHISWTVQGQKLFLFSCIDNLLKGAASQAVENFNHILDLPVDLGLTGLEAQI
ncbi:MAG: N-acetyl-gamma-glutamyl-phosphate reductase [Pseudobdellovibrio sp.]